MMRMSVDAKKLQKNLKKILKNTSVTFAKQTNQNAQIVVKDIKDRVAKGIDVDERPFKPLTQFTIQEKKELGFPRPTAPLIGTGAMTGALGKGGAYITKRATNKDPLAEISAPTKKAPYSIDHQKGIPQRGLPQRKWFGISKTAEATIKLRLEREIERLIANF